MTNSQEHELHVLNELLVATLDSANGYQKVAAAIDDRYASVFKQHASIRQHVAEQFEDHVRTLGGKPAHPRSILAAAHRILLSDSGSDFFDHNSLAIAIERSEERLSRQFEAALANHRLSELLRELVAKGYRLVKAGHDQAWDLFKHHLVRN